MAKASKGTTTSRAMEKKGKGKTKQAERQRSANSLIDRTLTAERSALLSMRKAVMAAAAGFASAAFVGVARPMPCGSTSNDFRSGIPPPRRMLTDRASARYESCIFSRELPGKEIFDIAFKVFVQQTTGC